MGGFRRIVLFIFSLAGLLCLAALGLSWYGLYPAQVAELETYHAYLVAVDICFVMTAIWLGINLLRSLFAHRRIHSISVMDIDGSTITVAKTAIASQASHVVEQSGIGEAKHVEVRARKRGPVDVEIRVTPYVSVDVPELAPQLHADLVAGLSAMCADRLGTVDVEFLEPRELSLYDRHEGYGQSRENPDAEASDPALDPDVTGDITILMNTDRED